MRNNQLLIKMLLLLFLVSSCNSDDDNNPEAQEFVVAFENPSVSFSETDEAKEIKLVFSGAAPESGTAVINYTAENTDYGTDFTTTPSAETGSLTVNIVAGTNQSVFTFNKLQNPIEGTTKSVTFSLASVNVTNATISGNTNLAVSFTEAPALGGSIAAETGGPNQPNQVYIDLSSQTQISVKRDSWDLGFYSGTEFKVVLNSSIYMATAQLDAADIDAITEEDVEDLQPVVAIGTFDAANTEYVDSPDGDITKTAIAEVSETLEDNKVYLLNLGYEIGTEVPGIGSVDISDDPRGWKKIRIIRDGDAYVLQYADLNETTHNKIKISKNSEYNFTFFSFNSNDEVSVEPVKEKWDLNFTVFTNEIPGAGSYGYSDFVVNNIKANVQAYLVSTEDFSYADFSDMDVIEGNFENDQRSIGSGWRNGGGPSTLPSLKEDIFYVIKDTDGNYYKLRFTALVNESGERGYPEFEYILL